MVRRAPMSTAWALVVSSVIPPDPPGSCVTCGRPAIYIMGVGARSMLEALTPMRLDDWVTASGQRYCRRCAQDLETLWQATDDPPYVM